MVRLIVGSRGEKREGRLIASTRTQKLRSDCQADAGQIAQGAEQPGARSLPGLASSTRLFISKLEGDTRS